MEIPVDNLDGVGVAMVPVDELDASAKGGDLKLCSMSKQVQALFELVRMRRIFDIYATRQEAARAFQS